MTTMRPKKKNVLAEAIAATLDEQCRSLSPDTMALLRRAQLSYSRAEKNREKYIEQYGHARMPHGVMMNDKWWVVVGSGIYKQTRDGPYNVVNVIHDHALLFFGEEFLVVEEVLEFRDRHPAIQWMHSYCDLLEQLALVDNKPKRSDQQGFGAAWLRFAYDLYTIRDNAKLKADLKGRLLSNTDFQAARYELKIAALCVTAGFELQFENERDTSRKHPEFVATEFGTRDKIAVEVKSRHRTGVMGFIGGKGGIPGASVDVRSLLLEAFKKRSSLPLYIFIDLNLPSADTDTVERWTAELYQLMFDLEAEGYTSPCPANAIFFTNDPSHYVGDNELRHPEDALWVRTYTPENPAIANNCKNLTERFMTAHQQRIAPPTEFYDIPM